MPNRKRAKLYPPDCGCRSMDKAFYPQLKPRCGYADERRVRFSSEYVFKASETRAMEEALAKDLADAMEQVAEKYTRILGAKFTVHVELC